MPRTQSLSSAPTVTPEPHDLGNLPTEPEGPGLDPEALVVPEPKKRKAKIKVQDPQHLSLVPQDAQEALQAKKKASDKLKEKRTKVVKKQAAARKKKSVTSQLKTKAEIQIPRNMLSEIWGVFFGGLSVLIMASLISYDPQDLLPTAGVTHDVINWVGPGGAQMAQLLSDFFGIGSYGLPLLTGYIAWLCFKPRVVELNWLRAVGAVLTVISTTALLHVGLQGRIDVPYPVGGVVGLLVGGIMNTAVAKLGAVVISLSTFLVGLVMLTEKSIGDVIDGVTALSNKLLLKTKEHLQAWQETRRLLREEKAALIAQWEEQQAENMSEVDEDERQARIVQFAKEKALAAIGQVVQKEKAAEEKAEEEKNASLVASLKPQPISEPAWIGGLNDTAEPYQPVVLSNVPTEVRSTDDLEMSNPTLIDSMPPSPIPLDSQFPSQNLSQEEIRIVERDIEAEQEIVLAAEDEALVPAKYDEYELPPLNLLDYDAPDLIPIDEQKLQSMAEKLEKKFGDFGILGRVREVRPGPVVTTFEFVPAPGIKVSKIANLSDDIAMAMEAVHVRIVAPIPGKGAVGIEIPNDRRETVYLKEMIADAEYQKDKHPLTMALGKDIDGSTYFANLADMPHVLISGTTGSGKSVSVNGMICSILYRASPKDVRFLMIDPKMLELSIYEGIPHLLLPPITDSKKAGAALNWAVGEMERRYQVMSEMGVRDLDGYNGKLKFCEKEGRAYPKDKDGKNYEHMPYIVVVVDEYADLISIAGKDVEAHVMRLAQKARACGIHVMLATQRPSVDVITGVIKANFPVRMGFRLASAHDSKTIVNRSGAEKLLGKGDMLIMPPGTSNLTRVHGAFISEKELHRVVDFLKTQGTPDYDLKIIDPPPEESMGDDEEMKDPKYIEALTIVARTKRCSTSWLQRQLGVGYNRAARLVESMERNGAVGPILSAKGDREIFVKPEHLQDGGIFTG